MLVLCGGWGCIAPAEQKGLDDTAETWRRLPVDEREVVDVLNERFRDFVQMRAPRFPIHISDGQELATTE